MSEGLDEQLYAAWGRGDEQAGRQLSELHLASIRRFVGSLLSGPEREDAVQEVFVRLARLAREGVAIASVRAFLIGIARNVVREQLRARAPAGVDFGVQSLADVAPTQSAAIAAAEQQRLLLECLHRLPIDDQILLVLRYWERLRTRELAQVLELNHSTVRTRLQRVEARLLRLIEQRAASPDVVRTALDSLASFGGWAREVAERIPGGASDGGTD